MARLTKEKVATYLAKKGQACPHCGSRYLNIGREYDPDFFTLARTISCASCQSVWYDIFKLVDATEKIIKTKNKRKKVS